MNTRLDRQTEVYRTYEIEMAGLAEEKLRAREQWSQDPCGSHYDREHDIGTREFFDAVEQHRYKEYAPWMPEVMGFNEFAGKSLLEVGCGMGTDLLQFARGGARVTGVDLTPRSLQISRQHLEIYGAAADFVLSDGEHLPFSDESFDVVYSNGVLHHTPDTAGAIRELHRVLRPGGKACVMLYHRASVNYWLNLMFRYGVLNAELFRGLSPEEIMSRHVEISDNDARPLVKAYTRGDVREMFSMFREVSVQVEQLNRDELHFLGRIIPASIVLSLSKSVGWNVIIKAVK